MTLLSPPYHASPRPTLPSLSLTLPYQITLIQEVPPGIIGVGPLPYCDRARTSSARGISLFWRYTVNKQLGHVVRHDDFP